MIKDNDEIILYHNHDHSQTYIYHELSNNWYQVFLNINYILCTNKPNIDNYISKKTTFSSHFVTQTPQFIPKWKYLVIKKNLEISVYEYVDENTIIKNNDKYHQNLCYLELTLSMTKIIPARYNFAIYRLNSKTELENLLIELV